MARFTNILIIGATGSIRSIVLEAFQRDSSFNLTVLQRASSKSSLSDQLKIMTIADSYLTEELVAAFKDWDFFRMVDAAITVGVQRYVLSEYALNSVFAEKGKVQAYLRAKAEEGKIEWMSISCGVWLKWGAPRNFVGLYVEEQRFVFWDDGIGYFSCTTEENTVAGLLQALKIPEETKNMNLFLSDFAITQKQLLDAVERVQGVKYTTETVNSETFIKERQEAARQGDAFATLALIETGFKEGVIPNEKLGLPKRTPDEVVAEALKSIGVL
ncbi:NmrA-like family protein [Xylaria telfairii]|nr:NmrA-like family protein [Xylaria telfairii]